MKKPFEMYGVTSRRGWKTQVECLDACDAVTNKFGGKPDCVFQLGLGTGDEVHIFNQIREEEHYIAIEPNEHSLKKWRGVYDARPGDMLIEGAVDEHTGKASLWSDTNCSSLYDTTAKGEWVEVDTWALDDLLRIHGWKYTDIFLWADCEGAELPAFKGGTKFMENVKWIWVETNERDTRPGWAEIASYLGLIGFKNFWGAGKVSHPLLVNTFFHRR